MMTLQKITQWALILCVIIQSTTTNAQDELSDKARIRQALEKSLNSVMELQRNGGWAMAWTVDGSATYGEHAIKKDDIITVQHPATPGLGMTMLRAYTVLDEPAYLASAMAAGDALIAGQLEVGGFPNEYYPGDDLDGRATMDDDTTQSATRFFMELWQVTELPRYRKAAVRCAEFFLEAQYENGGWPQRYPLQEDGYSRYITLNDHAMADVIMVLFECAEVLNDSRYYKAAIDGADCLLELQGEPPQAAWAQQFTPEGEPAPARRFEPVGVTTVESRGALELLKDVYLITGDKKYLEAGPPAFDWFMRSQLPNGKWARLYDYGSNTPIYSTEDGTIIYDVEKARPGYGWQGNYFKEHLIEEFNALLEAPVEDRHQVLAQNPPGKDRLIEEALETAEAMNEQGQWPDSLSGSRARLYQREFGEDVQLPQQVSSGNFMQNINEMLDGYEATL